ncbi:hypothetical protein RJ640_009423 [Escallonia rubra]|uniref:Subtilisin-like protease fibronectin type-III domain-containing protein n=1 Tax=Escallonia rubra TaxID=112253 RepID=A0AA88U345_9ASTE|nr:hypothetical protein RJ640_009423 [Escallonia rubra]
MVTFGCRQPYRSQGLPVNTFDLKDTSVGTWSMLERHLIQQQIPTDPSLGAAAYVKFLHPIWSPAAIKSAIMITARIYKRDGKYDDGAAAYVKSFHPTWSPAAVKSAIMTTGFPVSAYRAVATTPPELNIQVEPSVLSFCSLGQKASFTVTVTGTINKKVVSASLVWDHGLHVVRSPIASYLMESK